MERFKFYTLPDEEKQSLITKITASLKGREEIAFAYLHGSYLGEGPFKDIDLAIYLHEHALGDENFLFEIHLEEAIRTHIPFPIDVRILNNAPLSFKYSVIKNGRLLIENNPTTRVEFQESTLDRYFDFVPFRKRYLKETLGLEI
ncbi:nucleotidyltransferase domain-containing protein [Moorella naiadis]|uniref:type VII toxin-antitoxin system MntA family adenylyltransferase antitoxin n=1 Tax=Moorella naiadis (nom. illeg.) TaxID=3093670 RepID=UPI003D9CA3DC